MTPTPRPESRPTATLRVSDADAAFFALADTVHVNGIPLTRRVVDGKVEWFGEWPTPAPDPPPDFEEETP